MITTLIVIAAFFLLILLLGLIIPKELDIENTIVINKPVNEVFDFVKLFKNHDHFSVWNQMDPDMKKIFKGTDGEVGFVYRWESMKTKNVGTGEQEIKTIQSNKFIESELRFISPRQDFAQAKFWFETVNGNQTSVKWGFYSKMKFPMNVMKPVFKNFLTKANYKGLEQLKAHMEK